MSEEEKTITEKQRRVVEAAMEIFAEKGFAAASTAEIAKRAGVAEGTIFKTYKTKKDLLIGVVAPLFAKYVAPTFTDPVAEIFKHPWERLEDMLRALYQDRIELIRKHQRVLRIAMQELPFHEEVRDLMKQTALERIYPHASAAVERFQREGQIRAAPVSSVLRLMLGTFMTYAVTRVFLLPDRTTSDDDAEIELMITFVTKGLRPD